MDSEYQLVTLPADLAAAIGHERIFVEALELTGGALFRGAYGSVKRVGSVLTGVVPIEVPREHEAALEALFCEARRLRPTDDAATIHEADYQHAKAPHVYGRVSHKQNPGGYRRTGGHR